MAQARRLRQWEMRNVSKQSEFGSREILEQTDELNFDKEIKWYKVYDSDNGDVITGIDKLNLWYI